MIRPDYKDLQIPIRPKGAQVKPCTAGHDVRRRFDDLRGGVADTLCGIAMVLAFSAMASLMLLF